MTHKDIQRHLEAAGTKLTKEKLMEALRKTTDKDFLFSRDPVTGYAVVRVKVA